jgi:hypothetical protein
MGTAFDNLISFFDDRGILHEANQEDQTIHFGAGGDVARYTFLATSSDKFLTFVAYAPLRVPQGCRPAIAELITRVNYRQKMGKLEMGFDDGELRFSIAQFLPDGVLDNETIELLLAASMFTLETYVPATLSVIYSNELPVDAISHITDD